MDIKRLRHFLAVYETGSLTRAAELVYLTQPALPSGTVLEADGEVAGRREK